MQKTWLLIKYVALKVCGAFSYAAARQAKCVLVEYTHLKYGTQPAHKSTNFANWQSAYDAAFGRIEEPSNDETFSGPVPVGCVKMFSDRTV